MQGKVNADHAGDIISKVMSRIRKTTHKYGIEMATSVDHAYEIDKGNGNTLWRDAIKKEMTNVGIAFEVLEDGEHAPVAWRKVSRASCVRREDGLYEKGQMGT